MLTLHSTTMQPYRIPSHGLYQADILLIHP